MCPTYCTYPIYIVLCRVILPPYKCSSFSSSSLLPQLSTENPYCNVDDTYKNKQTSNYSIEKYDLLPCMLSLVTYTPNPSFIPLHILANHRDCWQITLKPGSTDSQLQEYVIPLCFISPVYSPDTTAILQSQGSDNQSWGNN